VNMPFQLNNLKDFNAYVSQFYFVLNINNELLRDNAAYYGKADGDHTLKQMKQSLIDSSMSFPGV
jgi:hypothetical protein